MARTYAGILGCLAMISVLARSVCIGTSPDAAATSATLALLAFALIGCALGQIAEMTVVESVRTKLEIELETGSKSLQNGLASRPA